MLRKEHSTLDDKIPRQTSVNIAKSKSQQRETTLALCSIAIIISIVCFYFFKEFSDAWRLYFTLQFVAYLEVFNVRLPVNCIFAIKELNSLVEF